MYLCNILKLKKILFFSVLFNHQIQVRKEDVEKTTFKTHDSHSEFLVASFGLSNALMNDVFRSYLCKFILVFLDDSL